MIAARTPPQSEPTKSHDFRPSGHAAQRSFGRVVGGLKGGRDHWPDTWRGHQPAASWAIAHGVEQAFVQQVILRPHRRMRLEQRCDDHVERFVALDQLAHTLAKAALNSPLTKSGCADSLWP